MDWGRAKNIILIVLLITNIFLIGVYGRVMGTVKRAIRSFTVIRSIN